MSTPIQMAIETLLLPQQASDGILRVKHGAQFSRFGGVAGWFLALALLIIAIVSNVHGALFVAIPLYVFCFLIIALIADYQGIELNMNERKIRSYRSFLGYRSGEWHSQEKFTHIKILEDNIFEERALRSEVGYFRRFDNHKYYGAYLVDKDRNNFIKLYENESVTKTRLFAGKFAEISGLNYDEQPARGETSIIRF